METLPPDVVEKLLIQENGSGLRPVEYAARLGMCTLLQRIMYTKNVYVTRELVRGATVYRWHDVTDYENGIRTCKSPLSFLSALDDQALMDSSTTVLLRSNFYRNWSNRKIRSVKFTAFIWFLMRLFYIFMFVLVYRDTSPATYYFYKGHEMARKNITISGHTLAQEMPVCPGLVHEFPKNTLLSMLRFIIAFASFSMLCDIIDFIQALRSRPMCNFFMHATFRVAQILVNISALTLTPVLIYKMEDLGKSTHSFYAIIRVVMPIASAWL